MFDNIRCFIIDESCGGCNDFIEETDKISTPGKIMTLEETVEYQKTHNAPILAYSFTNKALIDYFVSIGGKIISDQ